MTLINLTSRLPVEAVGDGYDLIMRETVNEDGKHYTTVWLRKNKEVVNIYFHVPSIVEAKEGYLEHKKKVSNV